MSFPQTKLADEADKILAARTEAWGTNPIVGPEGAAEVIDDEHGGTRWVPYHVAFPVLDASGLFEWTSAPTADGGPGSTQIVGGIDQAHVLAANVVIRGGDKSWSADYNPPTQEESDKPLELMPLSTPPKHWTPVVKAAPASDAPSPATPAPVPITDAPVAQPKPAPPETPIAEPGQMILMDDPTPASIHDHADSLFARIRNTLADAGHKVEGEAFTLLADFERTFEKLRAHL